MKNKYLIPFTIILILLLAACSSQPTAETRPTAAATNQPAEDVTANVGRDEMEEEGGEMMAAEGDGDMEAMADQAMDGSQDGEIVDVADEHDQAMDDTSMDSADNDMAAADNMEESAETMTEQPLWQTLAVTNVVTGDSFTLGDFKGKTVFVEPMATWCTNCRMQQHEVQQAKAQLGDDVVFVGLSLETTLPDSDLARYAQDNGFDWTYAVMSNELLAGLADEFGRSITSAPSTPHFIIRPDGSFSMLSTGTDSADEIIAKIQEAQS